MMISPRIAALFVERNGVYAGLPDVDVWDEERDARLYAGPWPVVAHPPCTRWCQLAGLVQARYGHKVGDDGGCFAAALSAVRFLGGVDSKVNATVNGTVHHAVHTAVHVAVPDTASHTVRDTVYGSVRIAVDGAVRDEVYHALTEAMP